MNRDCFVQLSGMLSSVLTIPDVGFQNLLGLLLVVILLRLATPLHHMMAREFNPRNQIVEADNCTDDGLRCPFKTNGVPDSAPITSVSYLIQGEN